jgi:hypothetical protein
VGEAVRRRLPTTIDVLTELSRPLVPAEDLGRFTQLALRELNGLHEGNIARFRLRPSEFRQWTVGREGGASGRVEGATALKLDLPDAPRSRGKKPL